MKYLFCSSVHNMADYEHHCSRSKVSLSLADHNLNNNIILGIDEASGDTVKLINNVQLPSYPKYPKIFFKKQKWSHTEGADDINCGFINLPFLKHISRAITTFSALRKEIKKEGQENICVLTYDIHLGMCIAMRIAKKLYPKIKTCAVLPDIPNAVLLASSGGSVDKKTKLKAAVKSYFINQFDTYVLLTEYMSEAVDLNNKKYVVMEGIYNNHQPPLEEKTIEKNIIFYSGQLNPAYGMENLLDAFIQITQMKDNYELWICGGGKLTEHITELSKKYNTIKYFGYVGPQKVRECQSEATVLVNPRQNIDEFTRFSFPSKTMEYLASGRLVLGYKLDGIPSEYDEHIIYVEGNSVEALRDKLISVCEMPKEQQKARGQKAREFILNNKNPKAQCKGIVDMLRSSNNEQY